MSHKLLLVDDESVALESLALFLEHHGYDCDMAENAIQARHYLKKRHYDLMISDIEMPGNEDNSFLHELADNYSSLPIILITGYPTLDTALASLNMTVIAYLVKPYEMKELLLQIERGLKAAHVNSMIHDSQSRLEEWRKQLKEIESGSGAAVRGDGTNQVKAFTNIAIQNIMEMLVDVKTMVGAISESESQNQEELFNCPQCRKYEESIEDAVEVLEATRHAFKSKQLGELRKKLVEVIEK